jgi:hypothetical protein
MIDFGINDEITVDEIDEFIEENDRYEIFSTRKKWPYGFKKHFEKLIQKKQIVTFREGRKLLGFCSWMLVNEKTKLDINKTTWAMPNDISSGDILYIDVCVIKEPASIFKIKDFLSKKYRHQIKQVFWFDIANSRVFFIKFKGGVLCQTADS